MRVGLFVEPMLLQRECGGADQVRALLAAFGRMPPSTLYGAAEVRLFDPWRECLDDYDLMHVIGAGSGNHQVVEAAAACGVPVLLQLKGAAAYPDSVGLLGRAARRLLPTLGGAAGGAAIVHQRAAVARATLVVTHSSAQRQAIAVHTGCDPARIRVVPPGIDPLFFDADPVLCRQRAAIRGEFALSTAAIGAGPELVDLAQALSDMMLPLVLCSDLGSANPARLRQLRAIRGVILPGCLRNEPRLLASVHAAASVYIMAPATGTAFRQARSVRLDATPGRAEEPPGQWSGALAGAHRLRACVATALGRFTPGEAGCDATRAALAGMVRGPAQATSGAAARGAVNSLARFDDCRAHLPARIQACAQAYGIDAAAEGSWPAATAGALAALATGTAVIGERAMLSEMGSPEREYAMQGVRLRDRRALQSTVLKLLEAPPLRERVRGLVREQGWDRIASRLLHCYADALALHGPLPNVFVGRGGTPRLTEHLPRQG